MGLNRTQLTTLAVAFACFAAVGMSATTLDSSVSSDPTDAVQPDYEIIPVAGDDVADLESQIANNDGQGQTKSVDGAGDSSSDGDGESDANPSSGSSEGDGGAESSGAGGSAAGSSGSGGDSSASGGTGGQQGDGAGSRSLFGGLGLFAGDSLTLLDVVTLLVGLALLLVLATLVYRYRDQLRALLATPGPDDVGDGATPTTDGGPPADANLVFEAWDSLVRDLDVQDPHTLTTVECARAATEAGFDPDDVDRLRLTFEAVRYGGRPVTDDRRQRVRDVARELDLTRNGDAT